MTEELLAQIPPALNASMTVASLAFVVAVWLLIHFSNRNSVVSVKVGSGLAIWYLAVLALGKLKFFGFTIAFVPFIGFAFLLLYFLVRFLYRNQLLRQAFDAIPIHWAIAVQIFRLMGYGFLNFHALGLIPGVFAIPTAWGDVAIGLTAPLVALAYKTFNAKKIAVAWNYLGIADLALALTLGTSTYPRPIQVIPAHPSNELIALFPLVMVPLFAVPLSILLHLFTLRAIKKSAPRS